uniref:Uncharacterized protein n=1 Tax=Eutreptiella gymnastica TaxID=73025 RepID=A0A7S4FZ37_9EUGL
MFHGEKPGVEKKRQGRAPPPPLREEKVQGDCSDLQQLMAQREKRLKELKKQEKRQKKLQQKAAAASASEAAAALANATVALTPAPVPRPVQGNACQKEELQREVASSPGPSDSEQVPSTSSAAVPCRPDDACPAPKRPRLH